MAVKIYSREKRSLECGSGIIEYELIRKSVKNVNMRIDSEGNVKVSANRRVPVAFIEDFIREKQDFIAAARERMRQRNMLREQEQEKPHQYYEGEKFCILGRELEIRVVESPAEGIYFDEKYLYLQTKTPENVRHKEILYEKWIKSFQKEVFGKICHEVHRDFEKCGIMYPEIRIRYMTSRWGSCQPYNGVVTLNSRLMEKPLPCIEYVVMHEFCHFVHPNHSKEFYALMTRMMPDWKQRKNLLDNRNR